MGLRHSPRGDKPLATGGTARRAATAALALWKIKAVIALDENVPALLFPAKDVE